MNWVAVIKTNFFIRMTPSVNNTVYAFKFLELKLTRERKWYSWFC